MNQSTINLRLTGKIILILSLFVSLNNYCINGLLNIMHGWSMRDFIFSLFVKKENKQFSMMQTGNNRDNVESSEINSQPFGTALLKELDFLEDEIKLEVLRKKFIDYNLNKSFSEDLYFKKFSQENSCIAVLHALNTNLVKEGKNIPNNLSWAKNKDNLIPFLDNFYQYFIDILRIQKQLVQLRQDGYTHRMDDEEFMYTQKIKDALVSNNPSIEQLIKIVNNAYNNRKIRFEDRKKIEELLHDLTLLFWLSYFHQCLRNNIYLDFFKNK